MLGDIITAKEPAPSGLYTALGSIDSDVTDATMVSPAPRFRPSRTNPDSPTLPRVGGLSIPEVVFHSSWDGGDVTLVGTDAAGDPQTEVLTASAGTTVTAVNAYATVTGVTAAGTGSGGHDSQIQCSEGWHVQLLTTTGLRINTVAGTLVQTLEGGSAATETFVTGDHCYGNVAIVGPASTATDAVAYGTRGRFL